MASPKVPAGWELETPTKTPVPAGWELEAQPIDDNSGIDTGVPGSPLEKALGSQRGAIVTVETPTGPTHFDRQGRPVRTAEEQQQMMDAGGARFKERALEGALSTLSGAGPVASMAGYFAGVEPGDDTGFKAYRKARASAQRDVNSATAHASPMVRGIPVLPMIGAALPSMLAPNPTTMLGRIGASAAVGAEQAADASDADLTRGEVGPLLLDAGKGLARGAGAAGVAEGLTLPTRWVTQKMARGIGEVAGDQAARDLKQVGKEVKHLQGVAATETQKGSRYTENILRHANGLEPTLGPVSDPDQLASIAATKEPWFKDLTNSVAANTRARAPGQKAIMDRAAADAEAAALSAPQDASNRTRDYFKQSTWGTQIKPRLTTLAENTALGGAAGAVTGGASGFVHGGLDQLADGVISGIGGSALSGGSGLKTLARNAMNSPLVQTSTIQRLIRANQSASALTRKGANVSTAIGEQAREGRKNYDEDEEDAIQAFMQSP